MKLSRNSIMELRYPDVYWATLLKQANQPSTCMILAVILISLSILSKSKWFFWGECCILQIKRTENLTELRSCESVLVHEKYIDCWFFGIKTFRNQKLYCCLAFKSDIVEACVQSFSSEIYSLVTKKLFGHTPWEMWFYHSVLFSVASKIGTFLVLPNCYWFL